MQPNQGASYAFARIFRRPQTSWFPVLAFVLGCGSLSPQPAVAQSATQTPSAIVDGSAKFVQNSNPKQFLRVVLGLERPHTDLEEQFLKDLHTTGTKEYRHFFTQTEWNARF